MRSTVALTVVLGGVAFLMFGPRWQGEEGWVYVPCIASVTGLIASIVGLKHGAVWYLVWMLGLMVIYGIKESPMDLGWWLGCGLIGALSSPMILIGCFTEFVKESRRRHSLEE
jgi:hypothetical protein